MTVEEALDKISVGVPEKQDLVFNGQEILDLENMLKDYRDAKKSTIGLMNEIQYLKKTVNHLKSFM